MGNYSKITVNRIGELPRFDTEPFFGSQAPCVRNMLRDRIAEIWFSVRDPQNRSYPAYYVVDLKTLEILTRGMPECGLGEPGTFDEAGVMVSQFVDVNTMLYAGWRKGPQDGVRYYTTCGKAFVDDPVRKSRKPMSIPFEKIGSSMPFQWGDGLYYMSYRRWEKIGKFYEPHYRLALAKTNSNQILEIGDPEKAQARPCGFGDQLWFCERDMDGYRLESEKSYKLKVVQHLSYGDLRPVDLELPEGDFMSAYPYVFQAGERTLILYNNTFNSPIQVGEVIYE